MREEESVRGREEGRKRDKKRCKKAVIHFKMK